MLVGQNLEGSSPQKAAAKGNLITSKPLLTLETIQHLRFPFAFSTFGVLGIMGYRSGILRLECLAFLSAIRIEKRQKKKGIAFEISHRCTGCWHLMTGDVMNQTSEVLTDSHIKINEVDLIFSQSLCTVISRNRWPSGTLPRHLSNGVHQAICRWDILSRDWNVIPQHTGILRLSGLLV